MPHLATLVILTMCTTLSLNMFLPGLPRMAADFDVSYGVMSLSVGGYLAVTALLSLAIGPLSDRIGRRPIALAIAAVFTLASAGAALATEIVPFLICRFAQGVMVGGVILASAVVRDTRADGQVASLLAYITASMAIAPLLGPMLGGVVTEYLGWRANFWIYAGMGAALLVLCVLDLHETRLKTAERLPATALLGEPRFWALTGTLALGTSCFYAFLAGAPLVSKAVFGLPDTSIGIALGSITAGFMAGSFAAGRLTKRIAAGRVLIVGRLAAVAGLAGGLVATLALPMEPLALFVSTLAVGIGNGLGTPTSNALLLSIRPSLSGTASGLSGAMTVASGAVITTVTAALLGGAPSAAGLVTILLCIAAGSLLCAGLALRLSRAD